MTMPTTITRTHHVILGAMTPGQWISGADLAEKLRLEPSYVRRLCVQLVGWKKLDLEQRLIAKSQARKMPANWYKLGTGQQSKLRGKRAKADMLGGILESREYPLPPKMPQHGGRVVRLTDTARWAWGGQRNGIQPREYAESLALRLP